MPMLPVSRRRFAPAFSRAPALLATTSVAALLMAVPAQAGQTITNQTVATVSNPAGNATTSIVISNSTVTGAVTNAGTITPGKLVLGNNDGIFVGGSTVGGGIANSGTINVSGNQVISFGINATQLNGIASAISGGITNSGAITVSVTNQEAVGINTAANLSGGISNTNNITLTTTGANGSGIGITNEGTVAGGISNSGTIATTVTGGAQGRGILVDGVVSSNGVVNTSTGNITVTGGSSFEAGIDVVNGATVAGGIMNAGTIMVSGSSSAAFGIKVGSQFAIFTPSTVSGGIANSGTINLSGAAQSAGIVVSNSTVTDTGVSNTKTITVSATKTAAGIALNAATVAGGVSNSGAITATGGSNAAGIAVNTGVVTSNGIVNTSTGTITLNGANTGVGIVVNGASVAGGIMNAGTITATGGDTSFGIETVGGTVSGGIVSSGTITVSGKQVAVGISVIPSTTLGASSTISGGITNSGTITANAGTNAVGIAVDVSSVSGTITNSGSITATSAQDAAGIVVANGAVAANGIVNTGAITVNGANTGVGIVVMAGSVAGGIMNAGKITAAGGDTSFGIEIIDSSVTGGISNSGTITATGKQVGTGIAISGNSPIAGGITNTGNITGSTAAISLAGETGVSNTVTQAGGTLNGSVIGSGIANGDVLNVTGGKIVLSGGQSISGFGTYNQSGGTLVFNMTTSTAAGTYPTLNAGTINLKGGTFELAPSGNLFALAAQHTTVYKNAIVADPPLNGSFAAVTSPITLFQASLTPDATTANALDATLTLSQAGLAASAQDLTQDGRLGLDAPRVLTEAIQDRLVANGGALGEWVPSGPAPAISKGPVSQPSYSFGNANVWARGYDQFGTATAQAATAGVGYNINRAAPIIAGVDWRLENNIVAGVAATYVATSAKFKDGSNTNVSSYQGAAYAGWAGGPWYAAGSVVASFNDFGTSRLLTPFGLPGDATSKPSGQSYQGHAEAGYHWLLPAASVNVSVTPYAALDYVYAQVDGFSETGGFGALQVNSANTNSFQTTLGVRLTSRIATASGTLTPELRLGWSHEFGDASQSVTAALIGVPGSTFTSNGILFGRDAALIGAGLSMELSPDAKVFIDYDGRIGSRLQEHSISGGLRLKFW